MKAHHGSQNPQKLREILESSVIFYFYRYKNKPHTADKEVRMVSTKRQLTSSRLLFVDCRKILRFFSNILMCYSFKVVASGFLSFISIGIFSMEEDDLSTFEGSVTVPSL